MSTRRGALFAVAVLLVTLSTACDLPARTLTFQELRRCEVAVLGDSLTVGVKPYLESTMERRNCELVWVDALSGRRTGEGIEVLRERISDGDLPSVLIVGLGTNDRYQLDQFSDRVDEVVELANGRHVIWIETAHLPIRARLNAILAERAAAHPNLSVMAWNDAYWAHGAWRGTDDVHCTKDGSLARAQLMARAAAESVVK